MIVIKGGVTTARGFLANALAAGIKKSGRTDLALLYSEAPCAAAASFTTNRFQASPVKVSKANIANRIHRSVIVNSGNANCANGKSGDRNAVLVAGLAAKGLGIGKREILTASTGIIGHDLPVDKIQDKMPRLVSGLSRDGGRRFSQAILTTDTVKKELAVKVRLGKSVVAIGGACKGVGMIHPSLKTERHPSTSLRIVPSKAAKGGRVEGHATLLAFLTTDAAISKRMLESALDEAVGDSFNMISVDGDMSTNDTCFVLANGLAANRVITSKGKDYRIFTDALKFVAKGMAKMLARDGEGSTKLIEIEVTGAGNKSDAAVIARKISTSNLLKCCVYGEDPNWGRVVASCGSSGVDFNPDKVDIYLGGMLAFSGGSRTSGYDKNKARRLFKKDEVNIKVDLNAGRFKATAWTCDFTEEYVKINAEYST